MKLFKKRLERKTHEKWFKEALEMWQRFLLWPYEKRVRDVEENKMFEKCVEKINEAFREYQESCGVKQVLDANDLEEVK
jgi:hypothetical protein